MAKEHRTAIEIARKVEQRVEADGTCGRCGRTSRVASEPRLSAARWPRPEWTLVKEANTNQDFYECVALSQVARDNPGPGRARVKEISILFVYEQEHTLVYRRWLEDMDVELIPTELKTVTSSLGRPVETRQIAIKILRERFLSRPLIPMAHTARKPAVMDLVVGRDNRKIFPELAQEACLKGDDFFLCNILFSPGQVIYGAAQKSIQWTKSLDDPEVAKKPQFRHLGKG